MKDEYQEIPYIRLTPTDEAKALEILVRGNLLLRKWSSHFPMKFRAFRNLVMSGKCPSTTPEAMKEFKKELPHIVAIRHEKQPDLGNRSVEQSLMESLSCLAKRHAKRWSRRNNPKGITFSDYLQEAYAQVLEALYQYTDLNIEISTYVWNCLHRRMINVTNQQGNLLSHLTNDDLKLLKVYEKVQKSSPEPLSFDQIVEKLNFSKDDAEKLGAILTTVFAENQLEKSEQGDGEEWNDYTSFRSNLSVSDNNLDDIDGKDSVQDILSRANLTTMERKLIHQAMENPYYGWQTNFAKTHINPETKKPYTRMRITQILSSARSKLACVIGSK